jgi:hypothetical protein
MLLIAGLKVDAVVTPWLGCGLKFVPVVLEEEAFKLACCSFDKKVTLNRFSSI